MKYTGEDVRRLVPEDGLRDIVHLIVIVCGEKPGSRIEADLAYGLLDTRRQLEIARGELNTIATQDDLEMVLDPTWAKRIAEHALVAIDKEGES